MSQKPTTPEKAERDARRAEALRANLKRRKEATRKPPPGAPCGDPDGDPGA
jgi:hypothetical protein